MSVRTAAQLAPGERLAGAFAVERILGGDAPAAVLAEGFEGGRVIAFVLDDKDPDPALSEELAAHWGTSRRVMRDPEHGRVVVDEIPEGRILAERLALGIPPSPGQIDSITRRVRDAHRRRFAHGRLGPECIVLAAEGPAIVGWGLGGADLDSCIARDLAFLARLAGGAVGPPTGAVNDVAAGEVTAPVRVAAVPADGGDDEAADTPTEIAPPTDEPLAPAPNRLQAAILSDHLPTLRAALAEWAAQGGSPDDAAARRAKDALARLERKVDSCLADARKRLSGGDPLGAVAPCREAIRLGAESEAEPLLRDARKQARRLVNRPALPSPRLIALGAGCACAAVLLTVAVWLALRPSPESARLREETQATATARGQRAAVSSLLARRERADAPEGLDELLQEQLAALADEEQKNLGKLHRRSIDQGGRPHDADRAAEDAVAKLSDLAARPPDATLRGRVRDALLAADRAAELYRGAGRLGVDEAARAVDYLLAADPAFAGEGRR